MGIARSTMAHANDNVDIGDLASHADRDQRESSILTSPPLAESNASDFASLGDEALKTDIKLLWAERENIDLKLKLRGVEMRLACSRLR
jgi:hypothetical protein